MEHNIVTAAKPIKIPGPDHPITIERNPVRIVVSVAGRIVADTREALTDWGVGDVDGLIEAGVAKQAGGA